MKKLYLKHTLFTALFLMVSIASFAQTTVNIDGLMYTLSDGKAFVAQNAGVAGAIVIPDKVTYNGTDYSVTSIGWNTFEGCTGLTSVTIPNSVTSIGGQAFYGCTGLTSVTIPNSVTSIGVWAFYGCTGLTSITIPDSVTSIGFNAFSSCTGLTSVTIPNSVTSIGGYAFEGCTGLTSVTIPNSVTSIGGYAFEGCTGLTSVTIPNSVTWIGEFAFKGCTGLTSIAIGNSVTSIGHYAFQGCTGLTSVTIPNSVTSIDDQAFKDCTGLTSVTIPNSVTSIGYEAFKNCTQLAKITTYITDPSKVYTDPSAFEAVTQQTCKLYVPQGTVALYKAAEVWKDFQNILEMGEVTDINSITESATSLIAHVSGSTITLSGLNDNESASFYTTGGMLIGKAASAGGEATFNTGLNNQVIIVKIGSRSIEVAVN